ncbi:hypothetical protein [Pontivivens nitratireducens]|uniref:hypothetical protein n=1 Tax=Pontivivens nitratireducens TaxID=2758038 RepID=UPI00163AF32A|nr:hypothetical protein [Pontibrevibacter nitratireducens]
MKDILRILIAPLTWLAAFSAIYGLHGVLCASGISGQTLGISWVRLILMGAYILVILGQIALVAVLYHPKFASRSSFVRFVSHATGWVGLVAAIWSLAPVVMTSHCG